MGQCCESTDKNKRHVYLEELQLEECQERLRNDRLEKPMLDLPYSSRATTATLVSGDGGRGGGRVRDCDEASRSSSTNSMPAELHTFESDRMLRQPITAAHTAAAPAAVGGGGGARIRAMDATEVMKCGVPELSGGALPRLHAHPSTSHCPLDNTASSSSATSPPPQRRLSSLPFSRTNSANGRDGYSPLNQASLNPLVPHTHHSHSEVGIDVIELS